MDMKKSSPLSVSHDADNESVEEEENCANTDIITLNKLFKKIEMEVLNLRDDLIDEWTMLHEIMKILRRD